MRWRRFLAGLGLLATGCSVAAPATSSAPTATTSPTVGAVVAPSASAPEEPVTAYITFPVNVHDWTHPDESAATLLRLVDLFERHGVRGDFYLTPESTRVLAEEHPEVIERLRDSDMTISYHVRPPHPLYQGFGSRLEGLDEATLRQTLVDYETYALDPATGDLDRSQPGGYSYVAEVFGRDPVVASPASNDPRIGDVAREVYADLGARMTVLYHETGTKVDQPFEYRNGLLVRPSDFSVARLTPIDGSDNFWWNMMGRDDAADYHPLVLLELQLDEWMAANHGRAPFITAAIHDNDFVRAGQGWSSIYYELERGHRGQPLSPPFDLDAPDVTRLRSDEEAAAIWRAYEELVAYAAEHLTVVTSEDIVRMAQEAGR